MGFLEGIFGGGNKKEEDKKESNPGGTHIAIPSSPSEGLSDVDFENFDPKKRISFLRQEIEDIEGNPGHPDAYRLTDYKNELDNLVLSETKKQEPL